MKNHDKLAKKQIATAALAFSIAFVTQAGTPRTSSRGTARTPAKQPAVSPPWL